MNCVIIEGDRSLYTCIDGKYYFPDRSFKEACVGFCRGIKVTEDNGMYGFFTVLCFGILSVVTGMTVLKKRVALVLDLVGSYSEGVMLLLNSEGQVGYL